MKHKLATTLLVVAALVLATLTLTSVTTARPALAAGGGPWPIDTYGTPKTTDSVILKWDEQLLSAIRAYPAQTGPTITARALGVLHTATYDAWAAYDPTAKGTRPDGPAQQTSGNTLANKEAAISYAAARVLNDLFPVPSVCSSPPNPPTPFCAIPPNPTATPPLLVTRPPNTFLVDDIRLPGGHHAGQHHRHRGHPGRSREPRRQGRAGLPPRRRLQPTRRLRRRHRSSLRRAEHEHVEQRAAHAALAAPMRPDPRRCCR